MNLKKKYLKEIIPEMQAKFGYKNKFMVPKIDKITINVGLNRAKVEKDRNYLKIVSKTISQITGQQPVQHFAKKSIAGFKIRTTTIVGLSTVLRSTRMYDFLERLINISLPRIRDFRGIRPESVDKKGNLTIGIKEHIIFPEIDPEKIQRIHGLQIVISTTAKTQEQGLQLFKLLGFPFRSSH